VSDRNENMKKKGKGKNEYVAGMTGENKDLLGFRTGFILYKEKPKRRFDDEERPQKEKEEGAPREEKYEKKPEKTEKRQDRPERQERQERQERPKKDKKQEVVNVEDDKLFPTLG